jgi:hypothetical protein
MQNLSRHIAIVLAGSVAGALFGLQPAGAFTFDQQEVSQDKFIAIAVPLAQGNSHNLLILEQLSTAKKCWQEDAAQPGVVDPLLLSFDFTGICGRSTDSNGYSVRVAGQDLGIDYRLSVRKRGGTLALVGYSAKDSRAPELVIGRTTQSGSGFLKIALEPGWRFAKRAYDGKTLGHIYLTRDDFPAVGEPIQPESPPALPSSEAIATESTPEPTETVRQSKPRKSKLLTSHSGREKTEIGTPSKNSSPSEQRSSPSERRRSAFSQPIQIPVPTPGLSQPIGTGTLPAAPRASSRPLPPPRTSSRGTAPFTTPIQIPVPEPRQSERQAFPPARQAFPPARQYQTPASTPSDLPALAVGVLPVPRGEIPSGSAPGRANVYQGFPSDEVPADGSPPAPPIHLASAIAAAPPPEVTSHRYRVIVPASGSQQSELRTLVPDAFRSSYRGQSVLQVGAYRTQQEADEMLSFLSSNGFNGVLDER